MTDEANPPKRRSFLAGFGPAIITASVVIGPGSILSASKTGYQFEYSMIWMLAAAAILMLGMTALSAQLGVLLKGTLCNELAQRAGRPIAAVAGVSLFLIAACFQFGNNLGLLAAIEPFVELGTVVPLIVIAFINVCIVVVLYGFKKLYTPIETMMKVLIGLMIVGFAGNLLLAQPDVQKMLAGLVPRLPEGSFETILPTWVDEKTVDGKVVQGHIASSLGPIIAFIATTFSVGAAFYQSYLVRQKGWTVQDLKRGFRDTAIGVATLGLISLLIMVTAAAVLYNNPDVGKLTSAADVAKQLKPAFGSELAKVLFCLGIFAGAFSSFLVNAMIGGTILSDGLGLGGNIDQPWPKRFTVLALGIGMVVAIAVTASGETPVDLIIFAQAMTVLAVPVLAAAMLWLATRADVRGGGRIPAWMIVVAVIGLALTVFLALRQAVNVFLRIQHGV